MNNWTEYKISTFIAFLIIFLIIAPTAFFVWKAWDKTLKDIDRVVMANSGTDVGQISTQISAKEKEQINNWIKENDLNQYGDPKGTIYAGGSPLFNEFTGENLDLYQYILEKHPDKPWRK